MSLLKSGWPMWNTWRTQRG